MKTPFVFAVLAVVLAFGEARANSMLAWPNPNPGQKFPLQGDCSNHGINPAESPLIDATNSTLACYGASQQMMRIFYSDGPQECVYIDNFNNDDGQHRAFFVPLRTSDEWIAFASYPPGGVRLRYGCPGQIFKDACGNSFGMPDMPASDEPGDVIKIATPGGYSGEFSCPMTLDNGDKRSKVGGCGAWKAVKESGSCTPAVLTDDTAAPPGTPGEPPSTVLPPGPPVGIPPANPPAGAPSAAPPAGAAPSAPPVGQL